MLIQNQIYTATITDYTIQGQGIAHVEAVAWLSMGEIGESTRGKQRNFDC